MGLIYEVLIDIHFFKSGDEKKLFSKVIGGGVCWGILRDKKKENGRKKKMEEKRKWKKKENGRKKKMEEKRKWKKKENGRKKKMEEKKNNFNERKRWEVFTGAV